MRRWENNIKLALKETGIEGIPCIVAWKGRHGGWTWPGRNLERQRKAVKTLVKLPCIPAEM